jgi:ABC-type lipoprotein release transport system permease subunit
MEAQIMMLALAAIIFVIAILIMRWVGAWMLRIDDVIGELRTLGQQNKEIIQELKKFNSGR